MEEFLCVSFYEKVLTRFANSFHFSATPAHHFLYKTHTLDDYIFMNITAPFQNCHTQE